MTALADTDYFEDEDYDSRSSRYDEGFGHTDEPDDEYDNGFDELDKLLSGILVDEDELDAPATEAKKPGRKAAVKAAATQKAPAAAKKTVKTPPKASEVITRRIEPVVAEPVAAASAAQPAAPAEALAAEADAEPAAVAVDADADAEEAPAEEPRTLPDSPFFAPHIAPVNEHIEFLRKLRPGFEVPYVDPMHSVDDCRILSLFSNNSAASPQGVVWAGDDAAATRLLGLQFQLGLRPEWMMPWNTHPWFTPGEPNAKLTPEQVSAGLKPLIALLRILPRVSAIVAHGTEANRLAQMLLKTDNPLIWRRGLKVYKARSLHGRSFAGSKERQTEWLIDMGRSYADAMARAGLQAGRR
ncbi:hypothetical protein QFZ52_002277 [Arthrobacter woluwensis]|nr:hypothetical protein [Arthrobacter woluwensis]MDQ0709625.1 hypothetical protein [Arthrobacter woluwensis]